ncbi:MAG: hypothetical protein AB8B79_16580 [Granulosicoccus sp.]
MYSLEDIKSRSESPDELVLSYTDAMELLDIFGQNGVQVLGWEGWIKYSDGRLGHSSKHQGTVDLGNLPIQSAIAIAKLAIMQSNGEWELHPEAENASLFFCLTTG